MGSRAGIKKSDDLSASDDFREKEQMVRFVLKSPTAF